MFFIFFFECLSGFSCFCLFSFWIVKKMYFCILLFVSHSKQWRSASKCTFNVWYKHSANFMFMQFQLSQTIPNHTQSQRPVTYHYPIGTRSLTQFVLVCVLKCFLTTHTHSSTGFILISLKCNAFDDTPWMSSRFRHNQKWSQKNVNLSFNGNFAFAQRWKRIINAYLGRSKSSLSIPILMGVYVKLLDLMDNSFSCIWLHLISIELIKNVHPILLHHALCGSCVCNWKPNIHDFTHVVCTQNGNDVECWVGRDVC